MGRKPKFPLQGGSHEESKNITAENPEIEIKLPEIFDPATKENAEAEDDTPEDEDVTGADPV